MNTIENLVLREVETVWQLLSRLIPKSGWFKTSSPPPDRVSPIAAHNGWFKAEKCYQAQMQWFFVYSQKSFCRVVICFRVISIHVGDCWNRFFLKLPVNFSAGSGRRKCRNMGALASSPRALELRMFTCVNRVPGECKMLAQSGLKQRVNNIECGG